MKKMLLCLAPTLIIATVLGCGNGKTDDTPTTDGDVASGNGSQPVAGDQPVSISAEDLTKEFAVDIEAAKEKYKGKTLLIDGKVASKVQSGPDADKLSLLLQGAFEDKGITERVQIRATFAASDLESLNDGDPVQVRGRFLSATPLIIMLHQAEIVE